MTLVPRSLFPNGAGGFRCMETRLRRGRFFITLDLDFAEVRRYRPESHPGILLLRAGNRSRAAVLTVMQRVLNERRMDSLLAANKRAIQRLAPALEVALIEPTGV